METRVPYTPVPSVGPNFAPTPSQHEETPIAAFGGLVAEATSHLGQVSTKVGSELFDRAYAMQQMHEQAKSDEAYSNFLTQAAPMVSDYKQKLGKDAVDAQTPFINSIRSLRENIGSSLTSPYAQQAFNEASRRQQGYIIIDAATHSAGESKRYLLDTLKSKNDMIDNSALANPVNDDQFNQYLKDKEANTDLESSANGWSSETRDAHWQQARAKLNYARIYGVAAAQPHLASTMLDKSIADGSIINPDLARLQEYVTKQVNLVGSRNIARDVMSGDSLRFGDSALTPAQWQVGVKAVEGGNYTAQGKAISNPKSQYFGQRALGAYGVMPGNLAPWLREANMPSMTTEQFLANPTAQDQLFKFKFGQYVHETGSFNSATDRWFGLGTADQLGTTHAMYHASANAAIAQHTSLGNLVSIGQQRAIEQYPNYPEMGDHVTAALNSAWSEQKRIQTDAEQRNKDTIDQVLVSGLANGKLPANIDEMIHSSPEAAATIHSMSGPNQLALQNRIIHANDQLTKQTNQTTWRNMIGLMTGDANDRDAFMSSDPFTMALSRADAKFLVGEQRRMALGGQKDPNIAQAMQVAKPMLDAEGISSLDKPSIDKFRGALIDIFYNWHVQNPGKPMPPGMAKDVSSRLLTHIATGGIFGGTENLFRAPLPSDWESRLRDDFPGISDADIEQERERYVQLRYQELINQQSKLPGYTPTQTPQHLLGAGGG